MIHRRLGLVVAVALLALSGPLYAETNDLTAFFHEEGLEPIAAKLTPAERDAVARALAVRQRELTNQTIAGVLRSPFPWQAGATNTRALLGTLLRALPTVAAIPGIDGTLKLAAKPAEANFRGYGVEALAAAALTRYRSSRTGGRAHVERMGAMIRSIDGRMRESDGAVLFGADETPWLVTVKSVSNTNAMRGSVRKAADQLALRNEQPSGKRQAGIMVVGYDQPDVLARLKTKNWQAAANRSGAELLVLALDQLTGNVTRLARRRPTSKDTPPAVAKLREETARREAKRLARSTQEVKAEPATARAARKPTSTKGTPQRLRAGTESAAPSLYAPAPRSRHPYLTRPHALRAMQRAFSR